MQNAVASLMAVWRLGVPMEDIVGHMWSLRLPEGRLEKIENPLGIDVYVDYAHTAEALQAVLQTFDRLKQFTLSSVVEEIETRRNALQWGSSK